MATPDGWTVEAIDLDGRDRYRVRYLGYLTGGRVGFKHAGLVDTVDEVAALLGDSFPNLN
jgi:hypothetical protein